MRTSASPGSASNSRATGVEPRLDEDAVGAHALALVERERPGRTAAVRVVEAGVPLELALHACAPAEGGLSAQRNASLEEGPRPARVAGEVDDGARDRVVQLTVDAPGCELAGRAAEVARGLRQRQRREAVAVHLRLLVVMDVAAGGRNIDRAVLHGVEDAGINHAARRRDQRAVQRDEVALRHHLMQALAFFGAPRLHLLG